MDGDKLKVLFGTAEASGENHAIRLSEKLRSLITESNLELDLYLYAVGSKERLEQLDLKITVPYYFNVSEASLVGFFEYIRRIKAWWKWIRTIMNITRFIKDYGKPDVFIAITSFPSNYLIAHRLKKYGVRCIYYMPPQIWVWGNFRLKFIKKVFGEVFTHFPFESIFFQKKIEKVINCDYPKQQYAPQLSEIHLLQYHNDFNIPRNKKILLLLPGSRESEIRKLLPTFLRAVKRFLIIRPNTHIHIISFPEHRELIEVILEKENFKLSSIKVTTHYQKKGETNKYISGVKISDFIVCSSGTITIDAMMLQKPMIICYKLNYWTYKLFRFFFANKFIKKINCFGLPNIYCMAEGFRVGPPIPEVFQYKFKVDKLYQEMKKLFLSDKRIERQKNWLNFLSKSMLNENHYNKVVKYILSVICKGKNIDNRKEERYRIDKREGILHNLSNVFDLSSYYQRKIPIQIIDKTSKGIRIISKYPLLLGRKSICYISYRHKDLYGLEDKLQTINFVWSQKEGEDKYIFGGERTMITG